MARKTITWLGVEIAERLGFDTEKHSVARIELEPTVAYVHVHVVDERTGKVRFMNGEPVTKVHTVDSYDDGTP